MRDWHERAWPSERGANGSLPHRARRPVLPRAARIALSRRDRSRLHQRLSHQSAGHRRGARRGVGQGRRDPVGLQTRIAIAGATDAEAGGAYTVLPDWRQIDGSWRWPDAAGFAAPPSRQTLSIGTIIDRYGPPTGGYLSPVNTSFAERSLPPTSASAGHYTYEVLKPLPVDAGPAAPAFNQPGSGTQYQLPSRTSVNDLIKSGYLKCVKGPGC